MKKTFYVVILLVLTISLYSIPDTFMNMQNLEGVSLKPYQPPARWQANYEFSTVPITLSPTRHDYFPGNYGSNPIIRAETPSLDGHWFTFQATCYDYPYTPLRVYKGFINTDAEIEEFQAFGVDDLWESSPAIALSEGKRPFFSYLVDMDSNGGPYYDHDNPNYDLAFGYDAVIGGIALGMHSDLFSIFDGELELNIEGEDYQINQLMHPIVQIGPSPLANHQRIYICGQNKHSETDYSSSNPVIFYSDFTESDMEYQLIFGNTDWQFITIPELNEWNASTTECRKPVMSFKVINSKLYYIGYHEAADFQIDHKNIINEASLDVFVCDNYGEGEWERYSIWDTFDSYNPNFVNPTGFHEGRQMIKEYFDTSSQDLTDEDMFIGIGQSSHFNVGVDNYGRLHIPALFTQKTYSGYYYPELHTVKDIIFNCYNNEFSVSEVYPQARVGEIDVSDNTESVSDELPWLWWDSDNDGYYDEVLDDGTWDGIDDNITQSDTDYWGMPVLKTLWPFQYWDESALPDGNTLPYLNHIMITDASDNGVMAMVWHDTQKSRNYNKYPDDYSDLAPFAETIETMISVSSNFGYSWSDPISLNNIDTPELAGQNPAFVYPANQLDYVTFTYTGNIMRLYLMYNDDTSYGSSVLGIGPETVGSIKYAALDLNIENMPVNNLSSDITPSMTTLVQNYPNPFNPETTIAFNLTKPDKVTLDIYNIKGQKVKTLLDDYVEAGNHSLVWNGRNENNQEVASGIYLYNIRNSKFSSTKKMILMK